MLAFSKGCMIDKLIEALDDVVEARVKLKEAESEYTGYSPSYHLASWYEAAEKAKRKIQ